MEGENTDGVPAGTNPEGGLSKETTVGENGVAEQAGSSLKVVKQPSLATKKAQMARRKRYENERQEIDLLANQSPSDIKAEQYLLASILRDEAAAVEGHGSILVNCQAQKLDESMFYDERHKLIYGAMCKLSAKNKPAEEVALADQLAADGMLELAGGYVYIGDLATGASPSMISTGHWCSIIKEKFYRRRLIQSAARTIEAAQDGGQEIMGIIEATEKIFLSITDTNTQEVSSTNDPDKNRNIIDRTHEILYNLSKGRSEALGVPTGFPTLDGMTLGFHAGQMIVVAARPGMGKTTIALNIIENALFDESYRSRLKRDGDKDRTPHFLFFSLEMLAEDLMQRLLASRARVNLRQVMKSQAMGKDGWARLMKAGEDYRKCQLDIDDIGGQTITEIRAKARRIHQRKKLDMIIIDYLQLINGTDSRMPREQQIAEASRSIKAMAKEFKIPIIALAQLNRESDKEDRTPRASDLRESGSIEQDADVILLIDTARHAAVSKDVKSDKELAAQEESNRGYGARKLIIAKQRNGPTGDVLFRFYGQFTRFIEAPHQGKDDDGAPDGYIGKSTDGNTNSPADNNDF
ncbi:MAG: replicative DNA helicase [Opitutales bacterium]|nr:replicative DNA helicase [Opitutales bacterium]